MSYQIAEDTIAEMPTLFLENATGMRPDCNTPLTLEHLREMNGKPVWVETKAGSKFWAIVTNNCVSSGDGRYLWISEEDTEYGKTWLAYAYPPDYIDREEWGRCWTCRWVVSQPIQCYSHIPAILQQQADFPLTPDAGAAKGYAGGLYHLIAPAPDGAVILRAVQERAEGQHPAEYQQHAIPKCEKHSQSHQQKPNPCGAGEQPPAPQHSGPFLKRKPIHTLHPLEDDLLVEAQPGDGPRDRPPVFRGAHQISHVVAGGVSVAVKGVHQLVII